MKLDLPAISAWNAANRAAREEYHRYLNRIETIDPSLCIEPGCDDLREKKWRCATHLAEYLRAQRRWKRANERNYQGRNKHKSAERQRRHRARKAAQG